MTADVGRLVRRRARLTGVAAGCAAVLVAGAVMVAATPVTVLVSINETGTSSGDNDSQAAAISADGRFVLFSSLADDLVANDGNVFEDAFLGGDASVDARSLVSVRAAVGSISSRK